MACLLGLNRGAFNFRKGNNEKNTEVRDLHCWHVAESFSELARARGFQNDSLLRSGLNLPGYRVN